MDSINKGTFADAIRLLAEAINVYKRTGKSPNELENELKQLSPQAFYASRETCKENVFNECIVIYDNEGKELGRGKNHHPRGIIHHNYDGYNIMSPGQGYGCYIELIKM